MDIKKSKTGALAVTRNINDFVKETGNIYETVVILSNRANRIASNLKEELNSKIEEFSSTTDNLEEIFENREQIEIAKYYERLPKPTLIAVSEYLNSKLYFRNPLKENPTDF
ncbi:MAG: DNA-directed RNA polymerase subunit omega [Bacteroidales bacterium]|jgi:DNA-directed RNA polymerase subunit K/omega|nr:DNA-directed RNA polymerase subunit omega [Bacteroidales bacterium]MDD4215238.1 DNA-directed RNA polymerase subunit omega [Bacteroidales bacterium]